MTAAAHKSPLPAVGDLLAQKYRIKRMLGAGGMGAVYMAHDESLGRDVAIKVLLPETSADKDSVVRFLNEARAAARIRNEHVPQVYEINKLENGSAYIVLEFLEGHDLGQVQKGWGTFPVHVAVDFIVQALEGIAAAHAMGIVHRDLKPANLFLTKHPDGSDCIKVLDFGISKTSDLAKSMGSDDGVTKTKALLGSPSYMAPEQFKNARGVDHRADIWSLGVILYKLLTNQKPFQGETPFELFEAVTQHTPQSLRSYRAEIPEGLEQAIFKCFARDPAQRFQNCAELAMALAPFGPPHVQASVDRICRTLQVSPNRTGQFSALSALVAPVGHVPLAPGDGSVSRSHVSQAGSYSHNLSQSHPSFGGASVSYSQSAGVSLSQSMSQSASFAGAGSLGGSQSLSEAGGAPPKSRAGLITAIVVLGLLVVGGGAFAAKLALDKKGEGAGTAQTATAQTAGTQTATAQTAGTPTATTAATTTATPTETAAAPQTATAQAAPSTPVVELPPTSPALPVDALPTATTAAAKPTATAHAPKPKPTASSGGDDILKMRR
jgi:serine/threonine-protein kinase